MFNERIRAEYNIESMLSEAYADDLTILFRWDRIGLGCIIRIIRDFERVSGLAINDRAGRASPK